MQSFWPRLRLSAVSPKHVLADTAILVASLYASLWLRLGEGKIDQHLHTLNLLVPVFVCLRLFTFASLGVYRSMWRYVSADDAARLGFGVACSLPLLVSATYVVPEIGYLPRSFFIIDAINVTWALMALRLMRRRLFERQMRPARDGVDLGRVLIYGAGQNGRLLAQRLTTDPLAHRQVLGFVDDDPVKRDRRINGVSVLGNASELEALIERTECTEVVVAMSEPPPELMRSLVVLGRRLNVRIERIARGEALYRQVELKDLLNRPSAEVDLPSVKQMIEGRVVLVTGAGGSIGSELARQISRLGPSKLLLLDHSEFALFEIDRELRPSSQDFAHVQPLLVDIKDLPTLTHVFETYRPQVIFHAAAYKHVHLVEANVAPAVLNNIGGTQNLLRLSERVAVERFVMISTDKAVNPIGAMGATKRVCELLTSEAGARLDQKYSSVRFGNVLGSSGSLVPLLTKQIEDGGPVTLTDPEMTRFFMLIPEAVSLVLMSATLSEPGDINVLKMGEPLKILELAKSLMALMGKREDEVGIAFTGARPGEKMYEELYLTGAELTTRHADILTLPRGDQLDAITGLAAQVLNLIERARSADPALAVALRALANPTNDLSGTPRGSLGLHPG